MTYSYRNVYIVFKDPVLFDRKFVVYSSDPQFNARICYGQVTAGREVPDLSDTAMKEFARKYIDVNYRRLCTPLPREVKLKQTPLSEAAVSVAVRIQDAANQLVRQAMESGKNEVTLGFSDLAERICRDIFSTEDLCEIILDELKEYPSFKDFDADSNEMTVRFSRNPDATTQKNPPQISM